VLVKDDKIIQNDASHIMSFNDVVENDSSHTCELNVPMMLMN